MLKEAFEQGFKEELEKLGIDPGMASRLLATLSRNPALAGAGAGALGGGAIGAAAAPEGHGLGGMFGGALGGAALGAGAGAGARALRGASRYAKIPGSADPEMSRLTGTWLEKLRGMHMLGK